ncbi:MAG: Tol-Pal system beta propeller repeat protein TolB [Devosiaceae bacterium]|nr:Tol-Pal system beta propeller repeat protein TolB [Devosiaceae bacterium]
MKNQSTRRLASARMSSRRTLLKSAAFGAAGLVFASPVIAQLRIVVSGAQFTPLPIAIPDFASSDPTFGREVADIVRANLRRSGLFSPLDSSEMVGMVGDVQAEPDFAQWQGKNVDAVLMGQVERGQQIQSSVRVWDTRAQVQVEGRSLATDASAWRRIAHIVSDAVYTSLTGESGYFDTKIVYVAESGPKANRVKRLAMMDQDGENLQYLTSGNSLALTPRYSPVQAVLAYMNYDDGQPQVYLLDLATGQQQRIGSFGQMTFSPRFSPDGRSLAFSVEAAGTTNLFSMPIGSGNPRQLTNSAAIDTSPTFSPDGARIAFESDRGGQQQIYIMDAGGGGAQRISYGQGSYSTPVWSPLGDLIAFTRTQGGQFHIGTMKPDGSGERILASSFHMEGPTWAPNGRVLMYFSDLGGNDGPRLYSIDVWGRNLQQVPTETFASDPAWSPLLG